MSCEGCCQPRAVIELSTGRRLTLALDLSLMLEEVRRARRQRHLMNLNLADGTEIHIDPECVVSVSVEQAEGDG